MLLAAIHTAMSEHTLHHVITHEPWGITLILQMGKSRLSLCRITELSRDRARFEPTFLGLQSPCPFQYLRPVETPQALGSISSQVSFQSAGEARHEGQAG